MKKTDTAHHSWDQRWQTSEGRKDWLKPEPDVEEWARKARERGAVSALDLGSGVGRHALLLASLGFKTFAIDGSESGIAHLCGEAAARGLAVSTRTGLMTDLPYEDGSFDYVLAFNVIYHGDRSVVERAIAEIRRVLKPGGLYQGTMLSKRDTTRLKGREIAPDTFVWDGESDKDHPHFYCSAAELVGLFQGFEIASLLDREHHRPGSWHWHLVAERL
jgi:SAM-dependent methyltransferase